MEKAKEEQVPFLSLKGTQRALDCSRTFIYNQVKQGNLKPRYIGKKPYFMVEEIMAVMK